MDITSSVLQGVLGAQNFQASIAKKADAVALLTGTLTGPAAAGGGNDSLEQVALQSSLAKAGGSAAIRLMVDHDPSLGHTVDVRA